MGYTHYWRNNGGIDVLKWGEAFRECRKIIAASDVPLDDLSSSEGLDFNGVRPNDHGPMLIPREAKAVPTFDFSNTACKPYDKIVVACLSVLAEAGLVVSSDGEPDDWKEGVAFASKVLGRKVKVPEGV
jgi:hypothetical protein